MIFAPLLPYIASIGVGVATGFLSNLVTPPAPVLQTMPYFNSYEEPLSLIGLTAENEGHFCSEHGLVNGSAFAKIPPYTFKLNGVQVPYTPWTSFQNYLKSNKPNNTYDTIYVFPSLVDTTKYKTCLHVKQKDYRTPDTAIKGTVLTQNPNLNNLWSSRGIQTFTQEIKSKLGSNASIMGNGNYQNVTNVNDEREYIYNNQSYINLGTTSPYSCYQIMSATNGNITAHYNKSLQECSIRERYQIDDATKTIQNGDGEAPNKEIMTDPSPTASNFYDEGGNYGLLMPISGQVQAQLEQENWLKGGDTNNTTPDDNTTDDNTTQKQIDYRSRLDSIIKNTADSENWLEKIKKMIYGEVEHSSEVKEKEEDLKEFEEDFGDKYNTFNINKNVYLDGVFNSFAVPVVGGSNSCDVHLQFSVIDREVNEDLCPWLIKLRLPLEIIFSLFLMYWSYRVFFFFYFKITDLVSKG